MVLGRPAALLFLAALGGAGGLKAPTLRAAASPRSSASSALFDGDDGAPPRAVRERLAGAEGVPGARRWPEPSDAPTRTPTLSAAPYPVHDDLYVRPNSPFARDWAWGDDAGGAAPGAVSLGASNGWCLTDAEAKELGELRAGLASRLGHCSIPEQTRVLTALDVAYQAQGCCRVEPRDAVGIARAVGLAELLARLRIDSAAIVAALLHGAVLSGELSVADGETLCGSDAPLLQQILKVSRTLSVLRSSGLAHSTSGEHADRVRQLVLVLSPDSRAVFVFLATRVLELRDAAALPAARREALAREALELFAPLAHRLNMWSLKSELEALCFELLRPRECAALHSEMGRLRTDCSPSLQHQRSRLVKALAADEWLNRSTLAISVAARLKEPFSVWQKLHASRATSRAASRAAAAADAGPTPDSRLPDSRRAAPASGAAGAPAASTPGALASLADILGLRVVFEPNYPAGIAADAAAALDLTIARRIMDVTHRVWAPVTGRDKDYISAPKPNGYKSLHSTVVWGSLQAEVQVRSSQMHWQSQFGSAAHWIYKEPRSPLLSSAQRARAPHTPPSARRGGHEGVVDPEASDDDRATSALGPGSGASAATATAVCAPTEPRMAAAASIWLTAAAECMAEEEERAAAASASVGAVLETDALLQPSTSARPLRGPHFNVALKASQSAPQRVADEIEEDSELAALDRTARLVRSVRRAVLEREVLVTTQGGQVLSLPRGANVGDAARVMQWIDEASSSTSLRATVNGKMAALSTKLRTGDLLAFHRDVQQLSTATARLSAALRARGPAHGWAFVRADDFPAQGAFAPTTKALTSRWSPRLAEAELKHGRIALLAVAHLLLRAWVGGSTEGMLGAATSSTGSLLDDLSFPPFVWTAFTRAAESAIYNSDTQVSGGAWTAWCVLLSVCGLVEGLNLNLSRHAEAERNSVRDLGAGSVGAPGDAGPHRIYSPVSCRV
ncbi:hypothetical protein KFE25_011573 [Diacronema lutheri]|uniref:RelA/SpoT domain-containing protein n=2 Tax=Diacronema lutheri TaxID=2081491 RepID=A0A8J5X935_DIALT|nr:hypothetical protein KFE25_011573 [Diacronema lutheri]